MSKQIFHFLYIDSNPTARKEVYDEFKKPEKILNFHEHYQVKITTYADFRAAMRALLIRNIENIREEYVSKHQINIVPFDSIIFEANLKTSKRYNWEAFLKDIQQIRFSRLNLNAGLIAFAPPTTFSPAVLESLMGYHVVKKMLSPFTHEQFGEVLTDYLNRVHGSNYFAFERAPEKVTEDNRNTIRRLIRFYGENKEERGITLDILEFDPVTLITRVVDDPLDVREDTVLEETY